MTRTNKSTWTLKALSVLALSTSLQTTANAGFLDHFTGTGGVDGRNWETATWFNGSPFGCTFGYADVWLATNKLVLNVNSNSRTCGEVRTWRTFKYGKFMVRFNPSNFAGGNTSFFLYTGTQNTASHHEIDIEIINGGKTLHTNVWKQGSQNVQQFPIATGWKTLGFEWRYNFVRWFSIDAQGRESTIRTHWIEVGTDMKLMLNHWMGDNSGSSQGFLGPWNGGGGPAYYDWVRVID